MMEIIFLYSLPLIFANILHHWVIIPNNLFKILNRPIDGDLLIRQHKIFGTQKTIRGILVVAISTSFFITVINIFLHVHTETNVAILGFLVGLGYMLGELPNSFLKRQLDIKESARGLGVLSYIFNAIDHVDSIIGAGIFLFILENLDWHTFIYLGVLGVLSHIILDFILHKNGYKQNHS